MTARPWKDPKTGAYHLRQRTPRDLLPRLKGQTVSLPVGDTFATVRVGDIVQTSLRTKETSEARTRHAIADGALKKFWDAQRNGPIRLSQRQIVALAGTVYAAWTGTMGDDPGPPEAYVQVLRLNQQAREHGKLEEWHGPSVDHLLRQEGLVVDDDSRTRLIAAVGEAFDQGTHLLHRNARGDFRPDPDAARFPTWEAPSGSSEATRDVVTLADLFERWASYNADKKAPNTIKRYRGSFRSLIAFAKDRDVRTLTADDLYAWAVHRKDVDGVRASAVNRNDLVAASSVFSWGMNRFGGKLLSANPAEGVSVEGPREVAKRERTFREVEITAILKAASAVLPDTKNPTFSAARRWCPWLAAYSGARIAELCHLEKHDIRKEAGTTVMDLRVTKTGELRSVPLHEHLLEMGFLVFVEKSADGPLFFDPARHGPKSTTSPAELRGHKVGKWVREVVNLDPNVDPNHGWRHTWKTRALAVGIEERLRDAMTGHKVTKVSRTYEAPSIPMLAAAMARFPHYEV